jgi:hypothetical protein
LIPIQWSRPNRAGDTILPQEQGVIFLLNMEFNSQTPKISIKIVNSLETNNLCFKKWDYVGMH